jgi:hypothetical protein
VSEQPRVTVTGPVGDAVPAPVVVGREKWTRVSPLDFSAELPRPLAADRTWHLDGLGLSFRTAATDRLAGGEHVLVVPRGEPIDVTVLVDGSPSAVRRATAVAALADPGGHTYAGGPALELPALQDGFTVELRQGASYRFAIHLASGAQHDVTAHETELQSGELRIRTMASTIVRVRGRGAGQLPETWWSGIRAVDSRELRSPVTVSRLPGDERPNSIRHADDPPIAAHRLATSAARRVDFPRDSVGLVVPGAASNGWLEQRFAIDDAGAATILVEFP